MELLERTVATSSAPHASNRQARVLVVDDHESTRLQLGRIVSREPNTRVVLAGTCEQALHLAGETTFDLILLDLAMPGIGGFEVLRRLRTGRTNRWTPVVVVSALNSRDSRLRCRALGANQFVTKPIVQAEIVAAVRALAARPD